MPGGAYANWDPPMAGLLKYPSGIAEGITGDANLADIMAGSWNGCWGNLNCEGSGSVSSTIQDEYKLSRNTLTGGFMCIKAAYQKAQSLSSLGPDSNESSLATASRSRQARMAGIEAAAAVGCKQLGYVESWVNLSQILSVHR